MRCDICGGEIPKNQEAFDTKTERFGIGSIPIGGFVGTTYPRRPKGFHPRKTIRHGSTETVLIALCPTCVQKRDEREPLLWIALGIMFLVVTAIVVSLLLK